MADLERLRPVPHRREQKNRLLDLLDRLGLHSTMENGFHVVNRAETVRSINQSTNHLTVKRDVPTTLLLLRFP